MTTSPEYLLSGDELRRAFRAAFDRLEEHRETVNALNVFPVPDGDTGTNMSLTLRSGIERCQEDDGLTAGEVAARLAQGTFFGARGNSGVILSQFFKGFGDALDGREVCSAADLARAMDMARSAAYGAVGDPPRRHDAHRHSMRRRGRHRVVRWPRVHGSLGVGP